MHSVIDSLEANQIWTLTSLPPGNKHIDYKWVYKIKYNPNDSVERYKARLVAKDYNQVEGLDYAPVAKLVTIHILNVIAAVHGCNCANLMLVMPFLHGL